METDSSWQDVHSTNLYQHLPIATCVWKVHQDGIRLADFNVAALELFQVEMKSRIGKKVEDIYRDVPRVVELTDQCRNLKKTIDQELEMNIRSTDDLRFLKCTLVWVDPDIILFMTQDVTGIRESKQQLEQLVEKRTQELQFAHQKLNAEYQLFSNGPVMVFVWNQDEDWPVTYVSENVEEILGYTPDEMKSPLLPYASLLHPDDLERVSRETTTHIEGETRCFEKYYRLRTKGGEYKWFYDSTIAERDAQGSLLQLRGYLIDQTELKHAELLLKKERNRLASILEGTAAGTWEFNVRTGEELYNERWAEIIGYSLAEMATPSFDNFRRLVHPDDFSIANDLLQKNFSGELDYYQCEMRMKHKNGNWIWVLTRGKVVKWNDEGLPQMMSGTHQDISKRKAAELKLKKAQDVLEDKVQQRTADLAQANMQMQQEIKDRIKSQEALQESEIHLEKEQAALQESNITLKVLMRESEQERKVFEEKVAANLMGLVDPYLNKLKKTDLDSRQMNFVDIIEANLNNITSPFVRTSIAMDLKLTPAEIQIANLIRENKSSKQIAEQLALSPLTIEKHRGNIRKKLGILNQKTNLRTLLRAR